MDRVSDPAIAERVHGAVGRSDSERARLLARASQNGTATTHAIRPPIDDGDRIVDGETLYRVSFTVAARRPATVYPIELNDLAYDGVTPPPDGERVEFADLPGVDREAFREVDLADGSTLGIGTNLLYTDAEAERSALVPAPEYRVVVWDPERRGLFGLRGEPRDVTLSTYRYSVKSRVPAGEYGRRLREEYAVELDDVSAAEADVLAAAIEGEDAYEVGPDSTPSAPFRSLADRFRDVSGVLDARPGHDHAPGSDPRSGTYLVRYDGEVYWTRLYVRGTTGTETATETTSD